MLDAADLITEVKQQENQTQNSKYPCPYTLAVLKVLESLNKNNDFEEVIMWSEKINPDYLNTKASNFNGRKYSSNKEKFYSQITKALLKLDDIDACYELSKKALQLFRIQY